jgi:hypothetical protein
MVERQQGCKAIPVPHPQPPPSSQPAFRRAYYETLGFEPQHLTRMYQDILSQKAVDVQLLRRKVIKFGCCEMNRAVVWKILLEVLPPLVEVWDEVRNMEVLIDTTFCSFIHSFIHSFILLVWFCAGELSPKGSI